MWRGGGGRITTKIQVLLTYMERGRGEDNYKDPNVTYVERGRGEDNYKDPSVTYLYGEGEGGG